MNTEEQSEGFTLLDLMMEEAARSQGMGGLQEPEKARKRISPEASQKELGPDDILAQ